MVVAFIFASANISSAYVCTDYYCTDYYNQDNLQYNYQNTRYSDYYYPNQQIYRSVNTGFGQQPIYYSANQNNTAYPQNYYQQQPTQYIPVSQATPTASTVQTEKPIINNYYYYQTAPETTNKVITAPNPIPIPKVITNTVSDNNTNTNNTDTSNMNSANNNAYNYGNALGASAYNGYSSTNNNGSDITALSIRGSGSFMPSSIWQWIMVIVLILIIIIIIRSFIHKPSPEDHTVHGH